MSALEGSVEALERQLKGLQMQRSPAPGKKVGPPPPPKKNRAQPQVARSADPTCSSGVYTNVPPPAPPVYGNVSPHAPPLPPPPPCAYDANSVPDEYLPPPSPVSSNYSELARATDPNYHQYHHYANYPGTHVPTYESIYEPIEPRAPSTQSHSMYQNGVSDSLGAKNEVPTAVSHSEYTSYRSAGDRRPLVEDDQISNSVPHSDYLPYGSDRRHIEVGSAAVHSAYPPHHGIERRPLGKEDEVDTLTELLVQSIEDSTEPDVYGVCIRCHKKVIGDASGCTAMEQIYHVTCFTCARCGASLQGRPFYAVEGQPYCERDYLDTLEKCSVCAEPVRDRILRATGKPYHPACFTCVACGKSLDGVPFTVDATNQIHCIEDFHAKFAPRCCVCSLPIMPEPGQEETVRVVALDRSFHVGCYRCEDCGLALSSEAEGRGCYPLDDHILCKACNAHRVRMLTNVITTDL